MGIDAQRELIGVRRDAGLLHELIAERSRSVAGQPAVVQGEEVLTHGQLETRSNQLAHHLIQLGARPEQLVGVCMERTPGTVVALLAILKAGAAYVPLDPTYPEARLRYMVDDASIELVVSDARSSAIVAAVDRRVVTIDQEWAEVAVHPDAPPRTAVLPDNLCYLIYTSGSTGLPKGSMNFHRGVINTLDSLNDLFLLGSADRVLQVSSLNFDMSVYELFGTLLAGACVVLPEHDGALDPLYLLDLLDDARVSLWSSAPPLFKAVVDHAISLNRSLSTSLRVVTLGGDRFPPALVKALRATAPGPRVFNLAGMTENSYCSTWYLTREGDENRPSIPWGRPLARQELFVLDGSLRPVPDEEVGELCIGGFGVGRGYWRRPALTAERFVPDPFSSPPGARMYRAGDLVRRLGDGDVEFLGRLDHQVKVRGFRIELSEVESALATHASVRDVVVVARIDGDGSDDATLVAYVTSRDGEPIAPAVLKNHAADRVPAYMVPTAVVSLPRLPLLPSGKIDRNGLPAPDYSAETGDAERVEPRSQLERQISAVWSEVMGGRPASIHDHFLDLGGHSVLAMKMMVRLRNTLGVNVTLREFLANDTIAGLARFFAGRLPSPTPGS